jgi:hypothetical protein
VWWTSVNPWATTAFGLACLAGGIAVGVLGHWWWLRRRRQPATAFNFRAVDPETDAMYAWRAREWAARRGAPEQADQMHRRLRLAHQLAERTTDRYGLQ